jgi:hypothetical protein
MELSELLARVGNFHTTKEPERIKVLAWYLHTQQGRARFDKPHIKACYDGLDLACPDLSIYFPRLQSQGAFLKDREGYRLEGKIKSELDKKFGDAPITIAVSRALKDLPFKLPSLAEQTFLIEVVNCYQARAFRAAIVMAWNLAVHHIESWLLADPTRLAAFNASLNSKYPRKGLTISLLEHFEPLKEFEFIEVLYDAKLVSKNIKQIMNQKLERRNAAAHPSTVVFGEHQASEFIVDLVDNVVLRYV